MKTRYRIVARAVFAASAVTGITMLPALSVSLFFREYREAAGFALCFAATLLFAGVMRLVARSRDGVESERKARDGMLVVSVWWIASSLLGGLPYMACGVPIGPADAVFESTSGFTTTGATILSGLSSLPRGLLLWRSATGWVGGLEILAASFAMLPLAGVGYAAAQAETSAGLSERAPLRERGALSRLCAFYAGSTLLLFLLLNIAGTGPFDALLLALGAASTSGFSSGDGGSLDISGAAAFFLCVFMLLAAVNFTLYRRLSTRRAALLARDEELRFFFLIVFCAAVAIAVALLAASPFSRENAVQSVGNAFFEAISAITTTGYHRADVSPWPSFCKIILLLLILTGGCVASVASGVKVGRIVILLRLVQRNIAVRLHPNAVLSIKFDGKAAPTDTVNAIAAHAMLCIAVFFVATAIVSMDEAGDSALSVFGVLACMSNAGPGAAAAHPSLAGAAWAVYSPPTKLFLSFLMILGRLEFTTVLLLFTPRYRKNE
jgi:trk system potassium uptake protein TrkH